MHSTIKERLLEYLKNGGTEEERNELIKIMQDECECIDIPAMSICTDDLGCEELSKDELEEIADIMCDYMQDDFSYYLSESLETFKTLNVHKQQNK